jgi:hypothetical protein
LHGCQSTPLQCLRSLDPVGDRLVAQVTEMAFQQGERDAEDFKKVTRLLGNQDSMDDNSTCDSMHEDSWEQDVCELDLSPVESLSYLKVTGTTSCYGEFY